MNEALLHATAAVLSIAIILLVTRAKAPGALRWDYAIGGVLVALGLYFFPLGAIEAYDATRIRWNLSESMNAVVWYILSTGAVVSGILFLKRSK